MAQFTFNNSSVTNNQMGDSISINGNVGMNTLSGFELAKTLDSADVGKLTAADVFELKRLALRIQTIGPNQETRDFWATFVAFIRKTGEGVKLTPALFTVYELIKAHVTG